LYIHRTAVYEARTHGGVRASPRQLNGWRGGLLDWQLAFLHTINSIS